MKRSRRDKAADGTPEEAPPGGEEAAARPRQKKQKKQRPAAAAAAARPASRRGERAPSGRGGDGSEGDHGEGAAPETAIVVAPAARAGGAAEGGDGGDGSEVMYIGHLPHGFYERELRGFFSQFGNVKHVKVSRSKRTARSKGYAFVGFDSAEVAAIACRAIDGYIMFGQVLKCSIVRRADVHPDLFKGCDRKFRAIPWQRIAAEIHDKPLTASEERTRNRRLLRDERKRQKRIADAGIDYEFGGYAGGGAAAGAEPEAKGKKGKKKKKKREAAEAPAPRSSRRRKE